MNWYKQIKLAVFTFVGDCIKGLENPVFQNRVAVDATELAQIVEGGQEISRHDFLNLCSSGYKTLQMLLGEPQRYAFYYNSEKNIAWYYDREKDIEYFYA